METYCFSGKENVPAIAGSKEFDPNTPRKGMNPLILSAMG